MKVVVVIAMHGAPSRDFSKRKLGEFFSLHMQLEWGSVGKEERSALEKHCTTLEGSICSWPRTEQNDPCYAVSQRLGEQLGLHTSRDVIVGFSEFLSAQRGRCLGSGRRARVREQQRHHGVDFRYA